MNMNSKYLPFVRPAVAGKLPVGKLPGIKLPTAGLTKAVKRH